MNITVVKGIEILWSNNMLTFKLTIDIPISTFHTCFSYLF